MCLRRPTRRRDDKRVSEDAQAPAAVLELGLLGPVQAVRAGGRLAVGGPKQRAVLALLVVETGLVVPADRLIEQLWRGAEPPAAGATLRSYVSRLRAELRPGAELSARGGGYVFTARPGELRLDVQEFERLARAGRAALGRGEAAEAANRFREALALWRGPALADVSDVDVLAREAGRLQELRLVALEGRIEADLALGMHAHLVAELGSLVAEHPVRERLWCQLVLALYRSERQADALAACRRARSTLAEELGLEPGVELRRIESAVLRHDIPEPAPRAARHNLPSPLTSFLGREHDVAEVQSLLGRARLVTLTGPGGAGKTRLAVEAARGAAERFADGAWLASLAGIATPALVVSRVMEALGVRQDSEAAAVTALQYRLQEAELLLVLDNCEHVLPTCANLVGVLLLGAPGLRVLATSREPLGVPGEVAYPVGPLGLPESADDSAAALAPAVRLFLERAAAARVSLGSDRPPVAVASRICRDLDGLPLAIELCRGTHEIAVG